METVGDEVMRWRIVEPGDVIEATGGPLFNPNLTYPIALVPCDKPQHVQYAVEQTVVGKVGERLELSSCLRSGQPLRSYHLGYKENEFWHWTSFTLPVKVIPSDCTDRYVRVHVDFSHAPDVVGIRTKITSASHLHALPSDREFSINELPIDEISGLQMIKFRNLVPCCAYFLEAWPLMANGTVGMGSLKKRVVTQAEVMLFFQEIGDTYLRIGFRRPPLRPPLHVGVVDDDARVEQYMLRVWEDPTASLLTNATRLSRGRQPQRYPLRKSEIIGKDLPCGVTQLSVVANLKPNTSHFVTLHTRGPAMNEWDTRLIRVRVRTCPELVFPVSPPRLTSTSISVDWRRQPAESLPFCDLDVTFPEATNLFSDREVSRPYIGSRVVELPDGLSWKPPTMAPREDAAEHHITSRLPIASSHEELLHGPDKRGGQDEAEEPPSYEIHVSSTSTGATKILRTSHASQITVSGLEPSSNYLLKVRTIPQKISKSRGDTPTPWSRPLLLMTPSDVLCKEIHRTRTTITFAWGRHVPRVAMPLDYEPGRFKYLADMNIQESSYEWYYYLEPLPFLCGDAVDRAVLSDSEDEEEVYADGCITGSGVGYLGKRSRIVNRQPRPEPLPFPCEVDACDHGEVSIFLLAPIHAKQAKKDAIVVTVPDQQQLSITTLEASVGDPEQHQAPPLQQTLSDSNEPEIDERNPANEESAAPSASCAETQGDVTGVADGSVTGFLAAAVDDKACEDGAVAQPVLRWEDLRHFTHNPFHEQRFSSDTITAAVAALGYHIVGEYTQSSSCGTFTFTGLPTDSRLEALFFCHDVATSDEESYPRLRQLTSVFTLSSQTTGCPLPLDAQSAARAQALWSRHLCDSKLKEDRVASIELEEVSEVFVTLKVGHTESKELSNSLLLTLLDNNAMEWSSAAESATTERGDASDDGNAGDREGEEDESGGEYEAAPVEYLLKVEQVEVVDGVRTVIGDERHVYLCTSVAEVQLVDLTAASRYEVSVATMSARTHAWTAFSDPISFTTVQKLLFELEEISSEYINLKWGRSRLDRITEFTLSISDLTYGDLSLTASTATSPHKDMNDTSLLRPSPGPNTVTASAAFMGRYREKTLVSTPSTRYRLDVHADLRPNAIFDCMVVPHYANGQNGLNSNALRFVHCSLNGRVVEAGVAHLRLEWTPPAMSEFLPKCGSSVEDTVVQVCLIRLRREDDSWERTVQCQPSQGYFILDGLLPQTTYRAHIAMIAMIPRCNCCHPPDPATVVDCASPFSIAGETLGQPTARIQRVWENAAEFEWFFEAEPQHQGSVELELRFVDRRHAESTTIPLTAEANGKAGRGTHIIRNLAAGRSYQAQLRQQYSRGTWGEWRDVVDVVRTLPTLQLTMLSISEASFRVRAHRSTLDCSHLVGMETAVLVEPKRFLFSVELLGGGGGGGVPRTNSTAKSDAHTAKGALDQSVVLSAEPSAYSPPLDAEDSAAAITAPADIRLVESTDLDSLIPDLEANTPYRITAQQWSIDDWGQPSQPLHHYTLNSMVPSITRRCDSYFEVHCSRDRRLPRLTTVLCAPHNDHSTVQYSKLRGVTLTATSLVSGIMTTRFFLPCTESSVGQLVGRVVDLEACHPYRVDLRTEYEQDETCPLISSLGTITAPIPYVTIAAVGEDFASLAINAKAVGPAMAQALDAFHNLAHSVRHAPHEGSVAAVIEYSFMFEPIHFDAPEDSELPQAFQAGKEIANETVSVPNTSLAVTKDGLMSEIPYNVFLSTKDEMQFHGKRHLIGALYTRPFAKLYVNKLSENFAEVEWREEQDEIGEDHTVSTVSGKISKRFGRWARIPNNEGYDTTRNGNTGDAFEFIIAEDLEVPDVSRPATRTAIVSYRNKCSLVEQLMPETQYFVIGRVRREIPDGTGAMRTYLSAWGPPARFATLALLVLRVVHCSLDFANIAWQDPVSMKTLTRTSPMHGPGNLPERLWESTTAFTKDAVSVAHAEGQVTSSVGGGAGAMPVRFQLRLMHATSEGQYGAVIEDMFVVTNDGIHTIEHLIPGKCYAVSMRVCYVGLSGSWVAPAVFRTDRFPEPKYLAITRSDVEMELDVEPGDELREGDEYRVPPRLHRLYEVLLSDSDAVRFIIIKVHHSSKLFIAGLVRGRRYRAAIREVINGIRYGAFVHLCSFWIQPFPPIITRLLECRGGVCEMEWTVIEKKNAQEMEDEEPIDFVFQLEQGVRSASDATQGEQWKEVVITDSRRHRFKWTENAPPGSNFSQLCFRVRASKCFVLQSGLSYKSPVWGDWSLTTYWSEAEPPEPVTHLKLVYCSDTSAVVSWEPAPRWEVHPNLMFTVKLRFAESPRSDDADPDPNSTAWFTVGSTATCAMELPNLAKATAYFVAVVAESSLGVNPKPTVVSFTTRYIPNPDPRPALSSIGPRLVIPLAQQRALLLPGVRPVDPYVDRTTNMFDKYEEPKKRRLRAMMVRAGMLDRTKRGRDIQRQFRGVIRRLISISKILHRCAVDMMLQPTFQPNEVYSPEQVARVRFGLDPEQDMIVWTPEIAEFFGSEEHVALRRTFSLHPTLHRGATLPNQLKPRAIKTRSNSFMASRRRHSRPASTTPSPSHDGQLEEGVSWTNEEAAPVRSASAGTAMQTGMKKATSLRPLIVPHGSKLQLKESPGTALSTGTPPTQLTTASSGAANKTRAPGEDKVAKKSSRNSKHTADRSTAFGVLSSQSSATTSLKLPVLSTGASGLSNPCTPSQFAGEPFPSSVPSHYPVSASVASVGDGGFSEDPKLVVPAAAAVDPAPTLPPLLRKHLLARLAIASST